MQSFGWETKKNMDWSFVYGLLAVVLNLFGMSLADIEMPAWLQQGVALVRENSGKAAASAHEFSARVSAVSDGDSIRVTDENGQKHRIRVAYIDAPELAQAGGKASREALKKQLDGKTVRISVFDKDQYGREVAKVVADGQDAGLTQLENGHAWHYVSIAKRQQNSFDYAEYAYAEAAARQKRSGLWREQNPQAPWDYRKQNRAAQASGKRSGSNAFEALW